MFEYWEQELPEAEVERLIEKAAEGIRRRKMETPAIFAIEMHKPLANVGANAALVLSPFLIPFFGIENVGAYSAIFRERRNLERLLDKLCDVPENSAPQPAVLEQAVKGA